MNKKKIDAPKNREIINNFLILNVKQNMFTFSKNFFLRFQTMSGKWNRIRGT